MELGDGWVLVWSASGRLRPPGGDAWPRASFGRPAWLSSSWPRFEWEVARRLGEVGDGGDGGRLQHPGRSPRMRGARPQPLSPGPYPPARRRGCCGRSPGHCGSQTRRASRRPLSAGSPGALRRNSASASRVRLRVVGARATGSSRAGPPCRAPHLVRRPGAAARSPRSARRQARTAVPPRRQQAAGVEVEPTQPRAAVRQRRPGS